MRTLKLLIITFFMLFVALTLASCANKPSVTVNFDSNGGSEVSPITSDGLSSVVLPSNPVKEGYAFVGWFLDDATFGIPFTAHSFLDEPITSDLTVYAKWDTDSYTLQFLDSDGTVLFTANYAYQADLTGLTPPIATKEGYSFTSWNINLPLTMPANHVTLTAQYTINQYTISFESNGGNLVKEITQDFMTVVNGPIDPMKDSYYFGGWFIDEELTTIYNFTTMPAEDFTLYAKWETDQYTINYYMVGVDQIGAISLSEGETIIDISLGVENSSIITSEGRVFTWGANADGQLGIGTATTFKSVLTDITDSFGLIEGEKVIKIFLGSQVSIALTSTGRIFTWGYCGNGQLGDTSETSRYTPGEITNQFNLTEGETIVDISLGRTIVSAITSTGRIFTWGWNQHGQIGSGEEDNIKVPTPIDITSQFNLDEGDMLVDVSVGDGHSSARTLQGRLFTWGWNIYGQLGNGTSNNEIYAFPIDITSQFVLHEEESIANAYMNYYHSSVITSEGRVFTWGYNGYGNLGNGNEENQSSPIDITSTFNLLPTEVIINISTGGYAHCLAITSEGRVFTWGYNYDGQLGIGTTDWVAHSTPIDITSGFSLLAGEQMIRTYLGARHSSAITSTGRIFTWGHDNAGQLGDASLVNKTVPVVITSVDNIKIHSETYGFAEQITEYVPYKEGYTFSGWYSDAELTIPYTFTTMPANTLKLYGMWLINS